MAGKKKVKKAIDEELTPEGEFEKQLASVGLADALELADETDENYECVTTGWPGVDALIGGDKPKLQGMPKHIHVEVFSELEHVGKTTFTLQIGVAWQKAKLKVGVIQIEGRMTTDYLHTLGYITSKTEAERLGLFAVRLMQPKINPDEFSTEMLYVEKILDTVHIASNYFDLLIVDSVDALVSEADSAKITEDGSQMGGVSKVIKGFMRKTTVPRSTILWVNHMSQGLGTYAKSYTTGGKAIPRYSTLRFKLERTALLRESDDKDPYGFVTKVSTPKNRVSAPFRFTLLYYIFGEGFSINYDYFQMAMKAGILSKQAGGHIYVLGEGKNLDERKKNCTWHVHGELNAYKQLRDIDTDVFDQVKALIDGEDVEPAVSEDILSDEEKLAALEVDLEEPAA
jgi:RecA/RadA recombinase